MRTYGNTIFRNLMLIALLSLPFMNARAQGGSIQVNGAIKDGQGQPVVQATIVISGTKLGAISDYDGKFTINAPADGILIITAVGFDSLQTAVKDILNITLKTTTTALKEAVVIGYGTVGKEELTGSVAKVDEKDFQTGTISTPEQLIAGKVAGVSITANGGNPGAGSTINIRGLASLNAYSQPLFVIDGLPINQDLNIYGTSNPMSLINPDDIESFTILKDGAATAIYGSRASGGVILITTKRGKKGKPQFSFTTNTSLSTVAREQSVLSASAFRSFVNNNPHGDSLYGTVPFKSLLGNANTNWQNEIFHPAPTTDDNFNVSGAIKNMPYRVSLSYLDQNGLLMTDNLQRYSGAINLSPTLLHGDLKININLKASQEDVRFANGAAISSAIYFDPTQPIYQAGSPYGGYFEWASGGTINKLAPRNPVALLNLYHNNAVVDRTYDNATFDYRLPFLHDLHVNLNLGVDASGTNGTVKEPAYAGDNYIDSGENNKYKNATYNSVSELYLGYNKDIPSIKSNINATAGYGFYHDQETDYYYTSYRADGDTIPGTKPVYPSQLIQNNLLSYYARLIYTLNVKYILAASVREDQSSRFPNEGSSGVMPSVAFTWRINKEKFLEKATAISLLNLRLSYGVTGQQAGIGDYIYESTYGSSINSSLVQFGNSFYNPATPSNANSLIKWEQTQATNIGIDFGFLKNRLGGSIDAYYKNTTNLIVDNVPLPGGAGFGSTIPVANAGTLVNKGLEFSLNAAPVKTKHFEWDVNFNVSYNENKITQLNNTTDSNAHGLVYGNGVQTDAVGYAPGEFLVYHQEYDKNGKPIEGVYADVNGDGVINSKDLYYDHSPFPKFIYGFTTRFSYDKWTLSTVLRANTGNYMYNSVAAAAAQANVFNSVGYLANTSTSLTSTNFYYNQNLSDYYVQNASFLKMDNVTLAYNFGKIAHGKLNLAVNAYCQNVFTITKYTGLDPEIYGGYDAALYPRPRIFGVGANIKF